MKIVENYKLKESKTFFKTIYKNGQKKFKV